MYTTNEAEEEVLSTRVVKESPPICSLQSQFRYYTARVELQYDDESPDENKL